MADQPEIKRTAWLTAEELFGLATGDAFTGTTDATTFLRGDRTWATSNATIDDHIAATGTSVHGLGTMSTQGAGAVAITGGTIGSAVTGTTQTIGDNSTKIATTAYADRVASTLATEQASTSGTVIDFTGLPAWVTRITGMLVGVSSSGTSIMMVQLRGSGAFETSGYSGSTMSINTTPTVIISSHSTGFHLQGNNGATLVIHGTFTLTLEDASDNTWAFSVCCGRSDVSTASGGFGGGTKAINGALTQIRITMVNGTDTFDAGAINLRYS